MHTHKTVQHIERQLLKKQNNPQKQIENWSKHIQSLEVPHLETI